MKLLKEMSDLGFWGAGRPTALTVIVLIGLTLGHSYRHISLI